MTLLTTVARGLLYQNHFSLYLTIYFVSACARTCAQVQVEARRVDQERESEPLDGSGVTVG